MNILCVGDSIAWGAWDPEGGWVARLRKKVEQRRFEEGNTDFRLVYNLGISGDSSRDALRRLPHELEAHGSGVEEIAIVVALGTNDCVWMKDEQRFVVDIEEFETNMQSIVDVVLERTSKLVLLGNPPVVESGTHPFAWDTSIELSNAEIVHYDAVTRSIAKRAGVPFVDSFPLFSDRDLKSLIDEDCVHPNAQGHGLIAELVWPYVETWL